MSTRRTGALLATALLAALACWSGRASAAPPPVGGLVPLAGAGACVSASTIAGCGTDPLVGSPSAVAVSPTGNAVYAVAIGAGNSTADELLAYSRNPQTGAIGGLESCWSGGSSPGCSSEPGLNDVGKSIAIGPGDVGVYVVASIGGNFGDLIAFSTNTATGALTGVLGCDYDTQSGCSVSDPITSVGGLRRPTAVAVSSDGRFVYAASGSPGGLAGFARDPVTGALTGEVNCFIGPMPMGTADTACVNHLSPDPLLADSQSLVVGSSAVYDVSEDADGGLGAVLEYPRSASSGNLSSRAGLQCFSGSGATCTIAASLAAGTTANNAVANAIAVAPNSSAAYVDASVFGFANEVFGTVTSFSLNSSGDLASDLGCVGDDVMGCAQTNGVSTPEGMVVSPDGADLYVAGSDSATHGYLDALALNGAASAAPLSCAQDPAGGLPGCVTSAALTGVTDVAVSPDDRFVYAAAEPDEFGDAGALIAFSRTLAPMCAATAASTHSPTPVAVALHCSDPNGNPISYSILSGPANGSLAPAGAIAIYAPHAGFVGNDSFTYQASDSTNVSLPATATITVGTALPPGGGGGGSATGPHSAIVGLPSSIRAKKLKAIRGIAAASAGVAKVQLGIVSVSGGAHAARAVAACHFLASGGRLVRVSAHKRACAAGHFLTVRGTTRWSFTLRHALPPGVYVVFSRAVARGGAVEAVSLRHTAANVVRTRVR